MPSTSAHSGFVHLRLQSAYSMLEGAIQPDDLAKACRRGLFPAAGLADRGNMFAAMDFSAAAKDAGVQPVIGAMVPVERPGTRTALTRPVHDWLVLFAQDAGGYTNLIALVSQAHLGVDPSDDPHLKLADFEDRTTGLLCLTAGADGALARLLADGQNVDAYAEALVRLFPGRLYIELSRCGDAIEQRAEAGLLRLAAARDLPIVATNPVKFLEARVHLAHDALLCIADSAYVEAEDRRKSNPEHRLKSADEMRRAFADLPEAIANTLVIAQRCAVAAPARKPILPRMAEGGASEDPALVAAAEAGLDKRLAARGITGEAALPYRERLAFELGVINAMGFPGYFLIVADFIGWAKAQGIPVGPGRGSGAGSVVAWALTITDLDPLEHGLLFERFLNPDRVSMPDFDIDFCETRRGEVIRYVQQRYGDAQVAQIITFGKMKARAVLKDVGRVLQMPYGQTDRLSKLVPNHPTDPWTLARTLGIGKDKDGKRYPGVPEFIAERDRDPKVKRLIEIALQLEGLPRHSSTHAAGVVIGDRPLSQLVPLYRDPRSDMAVTQFEMKAVEKAGLVKFDFLGLKTLSVLDRAAKLLKNRGVEVDWLDLPLDDPAVYALLARADTVGVFQFESEGMRRALGQVRPDCFADIVALGALYRPGPMDNIPSFANRKHKREAVALLHPMMEPILRETYGIIVYQEQVMQIARTLAGYSLGEADLLRRAMGKKIHAEMVAQKERFAEGAATNGIEKATASAIFDLVLKFANYGFNKSHAAAYALVSFQTAWLKAHHPVEFFAASMAYDITNTDRLAAFTDDARRCGVKLLPPCINASQADFSVEDGCVRYALAALKNVGEKAMEVVVAGRGAGYSGLPAFSKSVDPRLLNKRQLESLIAAGCFDGIAANRAGVHLLAEAILGTAQSAQAARESAQTALFGEATGFVDDGGLAMLVPASASWTLAETMAQEKEAFGFYFSGHPVEAWRPVLDANGALSFAEVAALPAPAGGGRRGVVMAGLIEEVRWRTPQTGRGNRYLLVTLSDRSGQYVASCFEEDTQARIEAIGGEAAAVLVQAELQWREGEDVPRITMRGITMLAEMAKRTRSRLVVALESADDAAQLAALVAAVRGKGRGELVATVPTAAGVARVRLGGDYLVDVETLSRLSRAFGAERVVSQALDPPRLALVG
ncbi:DNA polymerase III subunit alpha [Polymorphobacter fuscus]|uniref:DNA polymerase III subunit alpha n=1 Tax=Sandarakinorhabdus fusca TaxID=1439888 RepID=A0A7C9GPZ6_9SPHN|nr:DNA polymerase III subunit alpha [Polymorphobacter fuscus]KAB7646152.1 DNA polymerase III subunit alpha [Polymorphobacter fuscus]MQT17353.1 DNA polymerase III subunit alpha [Polymorphobacter fuscus]NJC10113.1 DNA polymerase-3 subunit alpha [Polymorphobacter fuscus]